MQNIEFAIGNADVILDSISDAFYFLDKDWRFAYINRQAGIVLDRAPQDLLGKNLWKEYPGLIGSELEKAYLKVCHEHVSVSCNFYFSGQDRWYEVHCQPSSEGMAVYFRNVTEKVLADARLRESEVHFRTMANAIPQIVWITDADGISSSSTSNGTTTPATLIRWIMPPK
jgi:PAS domain-containing protein